MDKLKDRCAKCFHQTTEETCPHCGWKAGSPTRPPYIPIGTRLNDCYLIGRVLGHGGFGITYLAWDTNLDMAIAIKEYFPREYATRVGEDLTLLLYLGQKRFLFEHGLRNFQEEARILAKFKHHPVIVEVYNFFQAHGTSYLVMEYISGINLKTFLKHKGVLSYRTTAKLLTPIMTALQEIHGIGLLHRDVSPHNIYITQQKKVKLLDFGAARFFNEKHGEELSIIIKPGYAPLEQYQAHGNQGPWTDIYGLAATFYHCITGEPPPDAEQRSQGAIIEPLIARGIKITPQVEHAILKGLALESTNRFQDIESFKAAFTGTETEAEPEPEPSSTTRPIQYSSQLTTQLLENTQNLANFFQKHPPISIKMRLQAYETPALNAHLEIIANWIKKYKG